MKALTIFDLLGETIGCTADEARAKTSPAWDCLTRNGSIVEWLSPRATGLAPESLLNDGLDFWPVSRVGEDYLIRDLPHERSLVATRYHTWRPEPGGRPFDMPLLGHGRLRGAPDREIVYAIQPRAEGPVASGELEEFRSKAASAGYRVIGLKAAHLAKYRGDVKLIAPWIARRPRTVSQVLSEITDEMLLGRFDISEWRRSLEDFPKLALRVVMRISQALIVELENGNLLNLCDFRDVAIVGRRFFDAPILEKGRWGGSAHRQVTYFIHPPIETGVAADRAEAFRHRLEKAGFSAAFVNYDEEVGVHQNEVVLLNPWSVTKRGSYGSLD